MNEDFEEFEIVLTFPVVLMEELTEEEAREYAALMAASEQDGGEQ